MLDSHTSTVQLIETRRFRDERGWFCETYVEARFAAMGLGVRFVQDNHSHSLSAGTVRGIHFQSPPSAQAKLVQCISGRIIDYAVDLRNGSPTFGKVAFAELSSKNGRQMFVPEGFGHAFVTLEPETEVAYKVSKPYDPNHDFGVAWNDPAIGIEWPLPASGAILSDKDARLPMLSNFVSPFAYDGRPMPVIGDLGQGVGEDGPVK